MKQIRHAFLVAVLVCASSGMVPSVNAADAVVLRGVGGIDVTSPCNGESVVMTGPLDLVFHAMEAGGPTRYAVHLTGSGTGTGDAGNPYRFTETADGQFDAPSTENATSLFFDVDAHLEVVSNGNVPNFSADAVATVRVSKATGRPNAVSTHSPSNPACHG